MSNIKEYDCPNCGGPLRFNPEESGWKCDYCFSQFNKEEIDKIYGSVEEEGLDDIHEDLDTYHCESCGADLIAEENTSATFCLYCKSPTIIKQRFKGEFKPSYVIPFKVSNDQAKDMYRKWIGKKFFAPTAFKLDEEIDKVTGMYAPFWLFNCDAHGEISGIGKKISTWRSGDYEYTKTKTYHVERSGHIHYDRIPVDGSKKLDDKYMNMIEPFDYKELRDFTMHYLTGFLAEKYDVGSDETGKVMEEKAKGFVSNRVRSTVSGYTTFTPNINQAHIHNVEEHYALMPIYILMNKFRDKEYMFFINGQTGKIVGDCPIDHKRQAVFFAAVFAVAWIITVLGGALFG